MKLLQIKLNLFVWTIRVILRIAGWASLAARICMCFISISPVDFGISETSTQLICALDDFIWILWKFSLEKREKWTKKVWVNIKLQFFQRICSGVDFTVLTIVKNKTNLSYFVKLFSFLSLGAKESVTQHASLHLNIWKDYTGAEGIFQRNFQH